MKISLFSSERIPFYITVATVIIIGCFYYFIHLPKAEAELKEWKFRTLQKIDKNIQSKIEVGKNQLNTYLKSREVAPKSISELNAYLKSIRHDNLPINTINIINKELINKKSKTKRVVMMDTSISLNFPQKRLSLTENYQKGSYTYELSLNYEFEDFIKPLLPLHVFDEYIVVGESTILYETFPSGLDVAKDSTLGKKGNLAGSTVIDREYSGVKYKLFVQPVRLKNDAVIRVVGLLSNDHFFHAKTRLPPRLVLFLITIFTCILVTFPIVKLYQLSNEDRLTLSDVLSIMIVSMFIMSIIFWVFIKYSSVFSGDKKATQVLSQNIKSAFLNEITNNYESLLTLNDLSKRTSYKRNFSKIGKQVENRNKDKIYLDKINQILSGIELDRIFWMGKSGIESRTWTSKVKWAAFSGDFSKRPYFENIVNNKAYQLRKSDNNLYIQPVVSWVSGEFLTDISIPSTIGTNNSDTMKVAVMSFKLKSLDQLKIAPGYAFAMIDKKGEVLYHSDSTKNLNENLFEEFSNKSSLHYSINTSSNDPFNTQYYGKEYSTVVNPVGGGIPYYLVVMEDLAFGEFRDVNVFSFTISMQLLIFLLLVIQIVIMFFASAKRSPYKNKLYETGWIGPKESSNWEYINCAGFNICVFIWLCLMRNEHFLVTIFQLLLAISSIPVFLNLLFVQKYHGKNTASMWYKIKAGLCGSLVPLILNIVALNILEELWWNFLLFELLGISIFALLFLSIHEFFNPELIKRNILTEKIRFNQSYTAAIFSWMLVAMGLPVIIFFRASYNYDQHVIARYNQSRVAAASIAEASAKYNKSTKNQAFDIRKTEEILSDFIYKDLVLVSDICIETDISTCLISKQKLAAQSRKTLDLMQLFHVYRMENLSDDLNLNKNISGDSQFNDLMHQVVSVRDSTISHIIFNGKHLRLTSASLNFHKPQLKNGGISWWILFFSALTGFFFILYGLINKMFSINIKNEHSDPFNKDKFADLLLENHVFLVGFSGLGKYELADSLTDISKMPQIERRIFDFLKILDSKGEILKDEKKKWNRLIGAPHKDKCMILIINHFECGFVNEKTNSQMLSLIENIMKNTTSTRIFIQSAIHPVILLDTLSKSIENMSNELLVKQWNSALEKFKIRFNPISTERTFAFLNIKASSRVDDYIFESLVKHHNFYISIWQSLSKEEKFCLYDLAEDGLVNSYDKFTLRMLLRKGLIKQKNGRMRLLTKGFRSFIMAGLEDREVVKLTDLINDNSHWNKIRLPLVIISLAILLFVLSSQQETSTKVITSLGALSAAIPTLINFLSTLGGVNSSKKS